MKTGSARSFSPKTAIWLATVCAALLAMSVVLGSAGYERHSMENRVGSGAFSASAIGYAGLYETFRRMSLPVKRGAAAVSTALGDNGTLVFAEPDESYLNQENTRRLSRARKVLLVLPKWRGVENPGHSDWIAEVEPVPLAAARTVLHLAGIFGDVGRLPWPRTWQTNRLQIPPTGSGTVQLIRSRRLTPIVANEEGMLIGELVHDGRTIWVLSDPDVMANHGIGMGNNIQFMISLFASLTDKTKDGENGPVVFDETIHGFQEYLGSPAVLLVRFPYSVVTALLAVGVILLVLAGTGRFGKAVRPLPNLDFGKGGLIANSARLLGYSGHRSTTVWSYIDMVTRQVAAELHAPVDLEEMELIRWLDKTTRARRSGISCEKILKNDGMVRPRTVDLGKWLNDPERKRMPGTDRRDKPNKTEKRGWQGGEEGRVSQLVAQAQQMYEWKGEMLDGFGADRGNRR